MKHQIILVTFCAIISSLVDCEKKPTPESAGPFHVNGETGSATGQAFGIEFIAEGASGVDVKSELSGSPQSSSRTEITWADDLKVELQTNNEGKSVAFELNGKSFGDLEKGHKVLIAKDRSLTVNGEKRTP